MKFVDLYHLIGVSAILLLFVSACCFSAKDNVLIVAGTGFLVFLILGVLLILERIEKRLEKIVTEVSIMKNEQESLLASLESINRVLAELKGNMEK